MKITDSLEKIYKAIPDVKCKGLCHEACGPVLMSQAEKVIIMKKYGSLPNGFNDALMCSKLEGGKCSIYADRPLVCRLYGAVEKMACAHGCIPWGGFLPERKSRQLLARAEKL